MIGGARYFTGHVIWSVVIFGLECSTVCSIDVDVDADRQKKIRSL